MPLYLSGMLYDTQTFHSGAGLSLFIILPREGSIDNIDTIPHLNAGTAAPGNTMSLPVIIKNFLCKRHVKVQ